MAATTDNDTTCTSSMPAGRYWVGDLCYVLGDAWSGLWKYGDGVHTMPDGRRIAMFATVHGDGIYDDDQGNEYGVDSGSLGCILADAIRDPSARTDLGAFVTATDPFLPRREYPHGRSPRCDGGVLHMAGVRIQLDCEADDGEEHDHGDGERCPGCRFREVLTAYLDHVAAEPEAEWHDTVGEVLDLLSTAGNSLVCLRAARFNGDQDDDDNAAMAAAAISRLGDAIQGLWNIVMDDDDA